MEELTAALQSSGAGPLSWLILTNGDSDPFDSVILFGFKPGAAAPSLVAKVPRMPANSLALEVEFRSLSELWSLLGEQAAARLPEPVALLDIHGQPVVVIGHISGENLLRSTAWPFFTQEGRLMELFVEAACSLRQLNDLASQPVQDGSEFSSAFERRAAGFARLFSLSPSEELALEQVVQRVESATRAARRKVLVQGDFWHGNLIRRPGGGLVFVDWQFAHWTPDVSTDVYLFLLAAALTGARQESQEGPAGRAAGMLLRWRSRIIPAYLGAYGQPSEYVLLPMKEGMLAACVEKAVRPALDFGYSHPDDLMWRLLFGELVKWPEENWILPAAQGNLS
jgi:hypothetical protein